MPLTTILIGLEVLKLALVCCFLGALVIGVDNPKIRNVLLALCILVNGGVIAFSIGTGSQMLLINNAVLLVLLVVWSFLTVFEIKRTWGEKI